MRHRKLLSKYMALTLCASMTLGCMVTSDNVYANETNITSETEEEWNLKAIEADYISEETVKEENKVKVAVLDSGIDFSENVNVVERKDFTGEDISPLYEDATGHGTAVAAVIGASGEGDTIKGINPDVEIYSAKILDENNRASIDKVVNAIDWAIEKKVNIINMSFSKKSDSATLHNAIKRAYNAGILMVASTGNEGSSDEDNVEYPAAYKEVVAVGAVTPEGKLSDMTSTGKELELLAPGEYIKTTGWLDIENVSSGTSFATPHVTGVASLLWQKDLTKSADFIRKLLVASAKTITEEDGKEYFLVDYEYACKIYDDYYEQYISGENAEINDEEYENEGEVIDYSEEVEGRWSKSDHLATVDYSYNTFNCYYEDVQIVKLGATAPDDYVPYSVCPSYGMFHALGSHNYVRVCEYIMNLAKCCKMYGYQSAMATNCKPDNVNDADYSIVKSWLGIAEINVMLQGKYQFNDKNASLIMLGIAIHVMGDAYAHKAKEYKNGVLTEPDNRDVNSASRLYYAKQSVMNLWTNYYNNIKTNGTDFEGNGNKFRLVKLYSNSIASPNGKSSSWSGFTELKKISCKD